MIDNNRYCSFIIIKKSRFGMVFLHEDKLKETNQKILEHAFAYAQCRPSIIQSDGAGEYKALDPWLHSLGIKHQSSDPGEQLQNGLAEKLGDGIGKGVRMLLLQSNLDIEFWGAAALYWVETRNHLPHLSIEDEIPIELHTGTVPNVGWFKLFGCRATVFRGKDHIDHHKISPQPEENQGYLLAWELHTESTCG